jgi:hypothetical protein
MKLNYKPQPYNPNFDVLPEGIYTVIISEVVQKLSQEKHNPYISLRFKIINGDLKDRCHFENLNLFSDSTIAQKIARQILDGICYALNITDIVDTIDLSTQIGNKPFQIKLGITKAGKNTIRKFYKMTDKAEEKKTGVSLHHTTKPTPPTASKNPLPENQDLTEEDMDVPF